MDPNPGQVYTVHFGNIVRLCKRAVSRPRVRGSALTAQYPVRTGARWGGARDGASVQARWYDEGQSSPRLLCLNSLVASKAVNLSTSLRVYRPRLRSFL
jgi:hypothetical protein